MVSSGPLYLRCSEKSSEKCYSFLIESRMPLALGVCRLINHLVTYSLFADYFQISITLRDLVHGRRRSASDRARPARGQHRQQRAASFPEHFRSSSELHSLRTSPKYTCPVGVKDGARKWYISHQLIKRMAGEHKSASAQSPL